MLDDMLIYCQSSINALTRIPFLALGSLGHLVRYPGLQNHTCSFVMTFSS